MSWPTNDTPISNLHGASAIAAAPNSCDDDCKSSDAGVNINAADADGNTALHHAARADRADEVKRLIAAGADACAVNHNGWTPRDLAHYHGHLMRTAPLLAGQPDAAREAVAHECIADDDVQYLDEVPTPALSESARLMLPSFSSDSSFPASQACDSASATFWIRVECRGADALTLCMPDCAPLAMELMPLSEAEDAVIASGNNGADSRLCMRTFTCDASVAARVVTDFSVVLQRAPSPIDPSPAPLTVCTRRERIGGRDAVVDFGAFLARGDAFVAVGTLGATQAQILVRLGHPTQVEKRAPVEWESSGTRSVDAGGSSAGNARQQRSTTEAARVRITGGSARTAARRFADACLSSLAADPLRQFEFQAHHSNLDALCTLRFQAFARDGTELGRAFTVARNLAVSREGALTLPLVRASEDGDEVVGHLNFEFLVVTPLPLPAGADWPVPVDGCRLFSRSSGVMGHRGLGSENSSVAVDGCTRRLQIGENTLPSFDAARMLGVEYVEFDVQLSSDNVPIVFHDYDLSVEPLLPRRHPAVVAASAASPCARQLHSSLPPSQHNIVRAPVHTLSLAQFLALRSHMVAPHSSSPPLPSASSSASLARDDFAVGLASKSAAVCAIPAREYRTFVQCAWPTLEELLAHDADDCALAFNCEIKYPSQLEKQQFALRGLAERNAYVDAILARVFAHAGARRRLFFSSFDADICTLVARKQSRYPVFFLTEAGAEQYCDPRLNSVREAVRFAKRARLLGVVSYAVPFVAAPTLARCVTGTRRDGHGREQTNTNRLRLLTWGAQNNEPQHVRAQLAAGVDAVIADHIARLTDLI
jgi:glycerophosphoryl diester phosphodiesterase